MRTLWSQKPINTAAAVISAGRVIAHVCHGSRRGSGGRARYTHIKIVLDVNGPELARYQRNTDAAYPSDLQIPGVGMRLVTQNKKLTAKPKAGSTQRAANKGGLSRTPDTRLVGLP